MQNGAWDLNPEDVKVGQARVSVPMIYNAVNLKSNILGMRTPKFVVRPLDRRDAIKRIQAEGIESLLDKVWDDEDMDEVYLNFCRTMGLYGRGIFQDGVENGESYTTNIDQQYNVWISWRRLGVPEAISFAEMVSEQEAMDLGWDGLTVNAENRFNFPIYGGYTHSDPLGIQNRNWVKERNIHGKIPVLHFYFQKSKNGTVHYARYVNGQETVSKSLGRKTWPFTFVEAEHIPGLAYGVGDAEPLLDIQAEYNIRRTEWAEAIRRNIKDQWKMWGLKGVNPRMVPGNGGRVWELSDKAEEDIEPLKFPVDDVGAVQNIQSIMSDYRRTSAIPAEAEADNTGAAPTSGYAMQVKFQALITQLAPRQKRIKRALKKGWALAKLAWLAKKYPEYADLLDSKEFTLDLEFEPLTPKDVAQVVQNLATAVGAKLESPHTAMEEMGLDPDLEADLMAEWWTDPRINPQGAMAMAQAQLMLQQVAMQSQQQPGMGFTGNQLDQRAREEAAAMAPTGDQTTNQWNPLPARQGASQAFGAHPLGGV